MLIQGFKEVVTALLGLMVVLYTLLLAGTALGYAGDATKMSNAKDILLLVLGLAGVVIGYYFGRVPADARATQAGEQADQANAQAADVSARAAPRRIRSTRSWSGPAAAPWRRGPWAAGVAARSRATPRSCAACVIRCARYRVVEHRP